MTFYWYALCCPDAVQLMDKAGPRQLERQAARRLE